MTQDARAWPGHAAFQQTRDDRLGPDALRDRSGVHERAGLDVIRIDLAGDQRDASTSVLVIARLRLTPLPTSISSNVTLLKVAVVIGSNASTLFLCATAAVARPFVN